MPRRARLRQPVVCPVWADTDRPPERVVSAVRRQRAARATGPVAATGLLCRWRRERRARRAQVGTAKPCPVAVWGTQDRRRRGRLPATCPDTLRAGSVRPAMPRSIAARCRTSPKRQWAGSQDLRCPAGMARSRAMTRAAARNRGLRLGVTRIRRRVLCLGVSHIRSRVPRLRVSRIRSRVPRLRATRIRSKGLRPRVTSIRSRVLRLGVTRTRSRDLRLAATRSGAPVADRASRDHIRHKGIRSKRPRNGPSKGCRPVTASKAPLGRHNAMDPGRHRCRSTRPGATRPRDSLRERGPRSTHDRCRHTLDSIPARQGSRCTLARARPARSNRHRSAKQSMRWVRCVRLLLLVRWSLWWRRVRGVRLPSLGSATNRRPRRQGRPRSRINLRRGRGSALLSRRPRSRINRRCGRLLLPIRRSPRLPRARSIQPPNLGSTTNRRPQRRNTPQNRINLRRSTKHPHRSRLAVRRSAECSTGSRTNPI
jgi:hypothetical protein